MKSDSSILARRVFVASAVAVAVVDQSSKAVASAMLGADRVSAGPVRLAIVHNSGGAFGIAPAMPLAWALGSMLAAITMAFVIPRWSPWVAGAGGAVLGGGVGNLVDRLVRGAGLGRGAVVDWMAIDPYPRFFNVADLAIRAGSVALMIAIVRRAPTAGPDLGIEAGSHVQRADWPPERVAE
jgi:signal peptidase II